MRVSLFSLFLSLICFQGLQSQKLSATRYWVSFTDKTGTPYSVNSPRDFLSERAIQRRQSQDIAVTTEDLPVSPVYLQNLRSTGVTVLGSSKWFNAAIIETTDSSLLNIVKALPFVKDFTPTRPVRLSQNLSSPGSLVPDGFKPLSVNDSHYGIALKQISLLNGTLLHDLGYRGKGKIIAVFDAGFYQADVYPAFDSLWLQNRILGWRDFGYPRVTDFFRGDSHGMSVLSTMGGNIPGTLVGTAPEASYFLLRSEVTSSETPAEEAWWTLAAEYADSSGADIINSSLGYSTFDDTAMNYNRGDIDGKTALSTLAAEKAFSKGMIVVVSAGNEGNDPWQKITFPSDGRNVIAVGAIDTLLRLAAFSSTGPASDGRTKPDVVAVGLNSAVITAAGAAGYANGTSFSGPQVAGMVACLWQSVPGKTNTEIVNAIRRSSTNYYFPSPWFGYGLPDFYTAMTQLRSDPPNRADNELIVVPNPNAGIFEMRLNSPDEQVISISFYSTTGTLVKIINNPEVLSGYVRINGMSFLQPGLYILRIKTSTGNYVAKMVKI